MGIYGIEGSERGSGITARADFLYRRSPDGTGQICFNTGWQTVGPTVTRAQETVYALRRREYISYDQYVSAMRFLESGNSGLPGHPYENTDEIGYALGFLRP